MLTFDSTYLISGSIVDYFYTQIIGDPTDRPVIKAAANFDVTNNFGLIDGNKYGANGLSWGATNVFFRQVSYGIQLTADGLVTYI